MSGPHSRHRAEVQEAQPPAGGPGVSPGETFIFEAAASRPAGARDVAADPPLKFGRRSVLP